MFMANEPFKLFPVWLLETHQFAASAFEITPAIWKSHLRSEGRRCVLKSQMRFEIAAALAHGLTGIAFLANMDNDYNNDDRDDVIKWNHFPRYWPFVRGIQRSPVDSTYKGQWRRALMFSLILRLNKRLCKQSGRWWFDMPPRSLWRHCNVITITALTMTTSATTMMIIIMAIIIT